MIPMYVLKVEYIGSRHYYTKGGLGIIHVKGFHLGWTQGWMGHGPHNCSVIATFARPFGKLVMLMTTTQKKIVMHFY